MNHVKPERTAPLTIVDGANSWNVFLERGELCIRLTAITAKSAIATVGDSSNTVKLRPVEYIER